MFKINPEFRQDEILDISTNYNLHPPLTLADQCLEQSYSIKYLGLVIDCFLSRQDHIDYISSKISKSVNIITKLKRHVTNQSLISISKISEKYTDKGVRVFYLGDIFSDR